MFKNSKKQGDAGLGQAIAYFTMQGFEVALPLTDSADWDLIIEDHDGLKRVQVKTSSQLTKSGIERFECAVKVGNQSFSTAKSIQDQSWDILFLYHLKTKKRALIPKSVISSKNQINLSSKLEEFFI